MAIIISTFEIHQVVGSLTESLTVCRIRSDEIDESSVVQYISIITQYEKYLMKICDLRYLILVIYRNNEFSCLFPSTLYPTMAETAGPAAPTSDVYVDHLVILLSEEEFDSLPSWWTHSFTVLDGGLHTSKFLLFLTKATAQF